MSSISIFSPAKINLTLDVFSKRTDENFHPLETIYHKVNWGDKITLQLADNFKISGDFDCPLEKNLIYKAWQLIQPDRSLTETCLKKLPPVKVVVKKNIPTGTGLGGGSSNAASFILAYFELFKLGSVPFNLVQTLGNLGKDIPFFLQKTVCTRGTHYGEVIKPLPFNFSGETVYLYFPPNPSITAMAYAQLKNFNTSFTQNFLAEPSLNRCGNTFETIYEHKKYSNIYLSGSGSAWFSFEPIDIKGWQRVKTTLL